MHYILNADDFGRTETVNEAIVYGFDHHYLDRTSIMVNMPFFEEAVILAEEHGFEDKVGLHINLTSGIPLTEPIRHLRSFCNENGQFNGRIFSNKRMMLFLTNNERNAVRDETQAQIVKFIDSGFTLLHADSHGHVHTFPSMQNVILSSLEKANFQSIRISANLHYKNIRKYGKSILNAKLIRFNKQFGGNIKYFDSYKKVVEAANSLKNENGSCEIMLHPNIYDGDMQIGEGLHFEDLKRSIS